MVPRPAGRAGGHRRLRRPGAAAECAEQVNRHSARMLRTRARHLPLPVWSAPLYRSCTGRSFMLEGRRSGTEHAWSPATAVRLGSSPAAAGGRRAAAQGDCASPIGQRRKARSVITVRHHSYGRGLSTSSANWPGQVQAGAVMAWLPPSSLAAIRRPAG
jgi:hypothetical protein